MLRPLTRLLRPLVWLMIRSGVTFPVVADLLRSLYVEVAGRDLLPGERPRTDSRISLLTGIHRKELRRQRVADQDAPEPLVVTLNSQLIGRWLGDPAYVGADGRPMALARSGPPPSFDALVATTTRDVRSRSVLDEWLSQRIATQEPDGRVVLASSAFLPRDDLEARLFFFARNLHDHVAAASANIVSASGGAPFLDRSVHYDGLGLEAAAALEAHARQAAGQLLLDINRAALAIADKDDALARASGPRVTRRVNLGVYLFADDEAAGGPGGAP